MVVDRASFTAKRRLATRDASDFEQPTQTSQTEAERHPAETPSRGRRLGLSVQSLPSPDVEERPEYNLS